MSANLEAYGQANEDLRHYGNLRFKVFGAFTAITGGLFALVIEHRDESHVSLVALACFNVAISLVGILLEWRINEVAEFYAKKVDTLAKELGMSSTACSFPPKTALGKWLGSIPTYVVYFGSIIMWVHLLL
jgi:hypothetical protein